MSDPLKDPRVFEELVEAYIEGYGITDSEARELAQTQFDLVERLGMLNE